MSLATKKHKWHINNFLFCGYVFLSFLVAIVRVTISGKVMR